MYVNKIVHTNTTIETTTNIPICNSYMYHVRTIRFYLSLFITCMFVMTYTTFMNVSYIDGYSLLTTTTKLHHPSNIPISKVHHHHHSCRAQSYQSMVKPSNHISFMSYHDDDRQQSSVSKLSSITTTPTTAMSMVHSIPTTNKEYPNLPISHDTRHQQYNTIEVYIMKQLNEYYEMVLEMKCPFFRRRFTDLLDAMSMVVQFVIIRHKSILPITTILSVLFDANKNDNDDHPMNGPLVLSNAATSQFETISRTTTTHRNVNRVVPVLSTEKCINITQDELLIKLYHDWKVSNHKGYYVTGKVTTSIYMDDVIFDGPDPDMPVIGLYKYMNAASQLFDIKSTYCYLQSIHITSPTTIVAKWTMTGRLRLPWKPKVPEWNGTTTYHIHPKTGLIEQHIETWDISVWDAFLQTLFPYVAQHIFGKQQKQSATTTPPSSLSPPTIIK